MDAFEKLLRKHRTSRFLVVDPEGGFGDQLILMGLEKKLREMNIHYRLLKIRKSPFTNKALAAVVDLVPSLQGIIRAARPDILESRIRQLIGPLNEKPAPGLEESEDAILLRGGAYLNDIWRGYGVLRLVSQFVQYRRRAVIIIAPQSFHLDTSQFLKSLADTEQLVHVFCRESGSYQLLRSVRCPENVEVHLSPDTALYLTSSDFPTQSRRGRYILLAPRLDRESVVKWKVGKIRRSYRKPIVSKDVNLLPDFKSFVDIVADASAVYTDRLHVAILAAILNKETYLLPNSYHKNKSAFEFSLKRFPNLKFINANEFPVPVS